jgi:hypothetical protein
MATDMIEVQAGQAIRVPASTVGSDSFGLAFRICERNRYYIFKRYRSDPRHLRNGSGSGPIGASSQEVVG